jgi:hypothetical protein
MPETVERVRETPVTAPAAGEGGDKVVERQTTVRDDRVPNNAMAARVVWLIAGVIMGLLAIRFILSLLGANRNNAFADLIYTLSYPFAAPFFGLFGYDVSYGRARFEGETLVAIAVFALLAWLVARIVTLRSRTQY